MQYGILSFDDPKIDSSRKIIHVDMDAFYASIEIRDNPSLKNKPVVIAKHPNLTGGRGIVSTCNYEARKYGIHSAMSAQEAFMRCPQAVFIPGNLSYYKSVSEEIKEIYRKYTDLVEPVSLDEAYLDLTRNKKNLNSATILGRQIQQEIYHKIRLTCSIGVSYNKFIAKIASDFEKPSGFTVIEPNQAVDFLKSLPIDKFHGVGSKSVEHFKKLDINTGEELYHLPLEILIKEFGKLGYSLFFKVRGIHNSPVNSHRERKSLGRERTYSKFLDTEGQVLNNLNKLIHLIDERHQIEQLHAHTITLKIRYDNFETISRQIQMNEPIESVKQSIKLVHELWYNHGNLEHSVRLLGVTFSSFENKIYRPITLNLE